MNLKYGKLDFEINIWDEKKYRTTFGASSQNTEGAIEIGWAVPPAEIETLYVFQIIDGQINWNHPENVFIPDDIKEQAIQLHKNSLIDKSIGHP